MPDLGLGGVIDLAPPSAPSFDLDPAAAPDLLFFPVSGPEGPTGPAGGATFTAQAATNLSGHRIVRANAAGDLFAASNLTPADANADMWLTTQAADAGAPIVVHAFGRIEDPSWSWTAGPVWLGVDGLLTQTQPLAPAISRQVATADGPSALFFNPRPAVVLA